MAETNAPRRRWFRFSLRFLALLITLFTVWLGLTANRANRQRYAVERIESHGGHFWYDYQVIARPSGVGMVSLDPYAALPVPAWLAGLLDKHYFVTPIDLHIRDRRLIESGNLSLLSDLPELEKISIDRMRLNRADLSKLPPLARLRIFRIEPSFLRSEIGLEDFSFLRGFPRLQELGLEFSLFDDDDARSIANAVELRTLGLGYTPIGDHGMKRLQRLTNLETLNLERTNVSDTGLASLRSFPRLQSLNLNGTRVTDSGLRHLQHLSALRLLNLKNTRVTESAVEKLRQALPRCRVRVSWDDR